MDDHDHEDPLFSAPIDAAEEAHPQPYPGPASDAAFSEALWYAAIRAHVTSAPALN